jgi:hypothetical protein
LKSGRIVILVSFFTGFQIERPDITTPYSIKALQEFPIAIALGIEGTHGDLIACMGTVVTYMKFSGGLKEEGQPALNKELTGSTRKVHISSLSLSSQGFNH